MGLHKRLDIQGLRAVAVSMVVAFHAGLPLPGGSAGVDVFFVISGFVITGLLARELEAEGRIAFSRFYTRRVRRLLPALAVMLLFVAAAGDLLAPAGAVRITGFTGVFASLFSANGYLYTLPSDYYSISDQLNPLLHTWTLAVEEQFYLVFPLLLVVGWRVGARYGHRSGRLVASAGIAALTFTSFVLAEAWSHGWGIDVLRSPASFAFYASPARAWEFGLGSIIALSAPLLLRVPALVLSAIAAVGVSAIAAACLTAQDVGAGISAFVIPAVGASCLLVAGTNSNLISSVLSRRPLVVIGDLSYSLYLWHWPFIVFARALAPGTSWVAPTAAVISIGPAYASYRWIENPIRRSSRAVGGRALALAGACAASPLLASLTLALAAPAAGAAVSAQHLDEVAGCDTPAPFGDPSRAACTWAVAHSRGDVVLIGDSNAGQFSEPVVDAARRAGYSASIATMGGCPFNQHATDPPAKPSCQRFQEQSLQALIRARPSLVITAARTDKYLSDDTLYVNEHGRLAFQASRLRLWTRALHGELATLNKAGVPVIVVDPVPELPFPDARSCSRLLLRLGGCQATVGRTAVDAALRPLVAADAAAVAELPRASTLNVEDAICSTSHCVAVGRDGERVYKDADHITVAAARRLTTIFYHAIIASARHVSASTTVQATRYGIDTIPTWGPPRFWLGRVPSWLGRGWAEAVSRVGCDPHMEHRICS